MPALMTGDCPDGRQAVVAGDSASQLLILKDDEAERQRILLLQLKVALDDLGIQAVVARNHHIGLPTEYAPVSGVCGLKPPILYVYTANDGVIRVQVNDQSYALSTGESFPGGAEPAAKEIAGLVAG